MMTMILMMMDWFLLFEQHQHQQETAPVRETAFVAAWRVSKGKLVEKMDETLACCHGNSGKEKREPLLVESAYEEGV